MKIQMKVEEAKKFSRIVMFPIRDSGAYIRNIYFYIERYITVIKPTVLKKIYI